MSRAPHPSLARLYAVGGAPARAMAGLGGTLDALEALARDLEGCALLSDAAIEPLMREIDLAALFARHGEGDPPRNEEKSQAGRPIRGPVPPPWEGEGRVRGEARRGALRPGTTSLPQAASPLPRETAERQNSSSSYYSHSAPADTGSAAERGGPQIAQRTAPLLASPLTQPTPSQGGGTRPAPHPPGPPLPSSPPAPGRGGRSPAALYARISPLPVGLPANTGGPGEGPGVRARAERAGVPTAADTPIASFPDSPARPEIQSILDRAASNVPSAPEAPRGNVAPPEETPTATLLARALNRLDARRTIRRTTDAVPDPEPTAQPSLPTPTPPPSGLRRLAGLAGLTGAALPALPAVARERQEEEELGRRIGRLLRREAERQGLDVAGVQG